MRWNDLYAYLPPPLELTHDAIPFVTGCRFGVGDSVGLAVQLENRYRGVRSPHKFKGGVSGCVRECAEAQGKDFGVIATDKGWNSASDISRHPVLTHLSNVFLVFVGGNGGATPVSSHGPVSDTCSFWICV